MKPVLVYTIVYVLELTDNCYYIGITTNLNYRYGQHICGEGAIWTRIHPPIGIVECCIGDRDAEDETTLRYMRKYGFQNVRGGRWCREKLREDPSV